MSNSRFIQISEMLKDEPKDSFLNYALALEHAKANDINKAIEIIKEVLSRDENYLGAYYQLGQFLEQIGEVNAARFTYTKGVSIAQQQKNRKTENELNEALFLLEDE